MTNDGHLADVSLCHTVTRLYLSSNLLVPPSTHLLSRRSLIITFVARRDTLSWHLLLTKNIKYELKIPSLKLVLVLTALAASLFMSAGTSSSIGSCNGSAGDAQGKPKFKRLSPLKESLVNTGRSRSPTRVPFPSAGETVAPATTCTAPPVFTSALSPEEARDLLRKEANYDCHAPTSTPKRSSYLSWDDYFMAIAQLSAHRSKDPKSPTGACLVDNDNRVVGIGYNGFPRGCSDDLLPWQRDNENTLFSEKESGARPFLHTPSPYECHAEINAILNKCSADVAGTRMYVAHFPCNECAKMIAQSRIRKVTYIWDEQHDSDVYRASRIILQMAGVETIRYAPTTDSVVLDLRTNDDDDDDHDDHDDHDIAGHDHSKSTTIRKDDEPDGRNATAAAATAISNKFRELLLLEANWIPPNVPTKRHEYLSWDDYFMAMAFLTAKRSKDPNTQVGACIVSRDKVILALGYNGFPRGCGDDCLPWARQAPPRTVVEGDDQPAASSSSSLHTKYPYVCHAEVNAILNKGSADVRDATLFVALFPCNECAKMIIQAGIVEVVYLQDHYHDTDMCRASRILFGMAGVKLRKLIPTVRTIRIELDHYYR